MLLSIYLRYFEDISRWDLNKDTYGYKNCWLVWKLLELAVLKVDDCKDTYGVQAMLDDKARGISRNKIAQLKANSHETSTRYLWRSLSIKEIE